MCRQEVRTQRRRWLALRRDSCGFDQNGLRQRVQGWNLTSQERRGNDAVEKAETGADNYVVFGSDVISHAQSRIEVFPLRVKYAAGPSLPFPANSAVQSQTARRAPFILKEEAVIGVVERAFRLIANRGRKVTALIDSNAFRDALLVEIGCLKAFKKDHVGMLAASGTRAAGIARGRDAL